MSGARTSEQRCALPEGWTPQVADHGSGEFAALRAPATSGVASTLSFRFVAVHPGERDIRRIVGGIVQAALASGTDVMLIDLATTSHVFGEATQAVYAGRIGPYAVTTTVSSVPFGDGALVVLGTADADHQPCDGAIFEHAFTSLCVMDAAGCVTLPVLGGDNSAAPQLRLRLETPLGWSPQAVPSGDMAISVSGASNATLSAAWRAVAAEESAEHRHAAHVADAAEYLVDLQPERDVIVRLAGGLGPCTIATCRRAATTMRALLATVDTDGAGAIFVVGLCEIDDAGAISDMERAMAAIELVAA